jgi:hypothetical protein
MEIVHPVNNKNIIGKMRQVLNYWCKLTFTKLMLVVVPSMSSKKHCTADILAVKAKLMTNK